jgi:hypothetical protein
MQQNIPSHPGWVHEQVALFTPSLLVCWTIGIEWTHLLACLVLTCTASTAAGHAGIMLSWKLLCDLFEEQNKTLPSLLIINKCYQLPKVHFLFFEFFLRAAIGGNATWKKRLEEDET